MQLEHAISTGGSRFFDCLWAALVAALLCTGVAGQPALAPATATLSPATVPRSLLASTPEAEYKVGPQDLLEIQVWGQPDMARTVRVNLQGRISLPLIGPIDAVGLTAQQLEKSISDRLGERFLQDPQVTVFIKEFTTLRFTIEGAVNKPGVYPLSGQITLLRALAVAGGQGQLSDMSDVMLFRLAANGERQAMSFDIEKIRNGEVTDPLIANDDLVVVKRSKARAAVKDSLFGDLLQTLNPFSFLR